jgi:hypothetical protein
MGLDTKTYWLTDRHSQCDFDFDFDLNVGVAESARMRMRHVLVNCEDQRQRYN